MTLTAQSMKLAAVLLAVGAAFSAAGTIAAAADTPAQVKNAVPATDATWKSISAKVQELDGLIRAGKLGDLGSSAYGIANLVKTLPAQSTGLPADKLAQVTGSVKVVGGHVSKLDKAGESNDKAGVEAHYKSLQDTLAALHAIYFGPPPGK